MSNGMRSTDAFFFIACRKHSKVVLVNAHATLRCYSAAGASRTLSHLSVAPAAFFAFISFSFSPSRMGKCAISRDTCLSRNNPAHTVAHRRKEVDALEAPPTLPVKPRPKCLPHVTVGAVALCHGPFFFAKILVREGPVPSGTAFSSSRPFFSFVVNSPAPIPRFGLTQ